MTPILSNLQHLAYFFPPPLFLLRIRIKHHNVNEDAVIKVDEVCPEKSGRDPRPARGL